MLIILDPLPPLAPHHLHRRHQCHAAHVGSSPSLIASLFPRSFVLVTLSIFVSGVIIVSGMDGGAQSPCLRQRQVSSAWCRNVWRVFSTGALPPLSGGELSRASFPEVPRTSVECGRSHGGRLTTPCLCPSSSAKTLWFIRAETAHRGLPPLHKASAGRHQSLFLVYSRIEPFCEGW